MNSVVFEILRAVSVDMYCVKVKWLDVPPMTKPSHLPNNLSDNTFSENCREHTLDPFPFDFWFISD